MKRQVSLKDSICERANWLEQVSKPYRRHLKFNNVERNPLKRWARQFNRHVTREKYNKEHMKNVPYSRIWEIQIKPDAITYL